MPSGMRCETAARPDDLENHPRQTIRLPSLISPSGYSAVAATASTTRRASAGIARASSVKCDGLKQIVR